MTFIKFHSIFLPELNFFLIHGGCMSTFNPDMLKIARDLRGMSQTELVQKMKNITQAALSKIEKGDLKPSEETKKQLAKALNFPERFFSQLDHFKVSPISLHAYRKKASTTAKVLSQINAEMTIKASNLETLNLFSQLDEKRPLPSYQIYMNVSTASEAARNLRKVWGLGLDPIENLTEVIEQSGIYIFYCDFEEDHIDGVSLQTQNCPPCIFLNKNQPNDRIRFTLAHELGHLVLHKFAPSIDMEDEANEFAAEFLVPTEAIKGQLQTTNLKTYAAHKLVWKVSMAALIVKAKNIGDISDRQSTTLWRQMSMYGYRKVEPYPLEKEYPQRFAELMVNFCQKDRNKIMNELPSFFNLYPEDFYQLYKSDIEAVEQIMKVS